MLTPQITNEVEILIDDRGREIPTGTKRNELYQKAKGEYVCSIDCDDEIATFYVSEVIKYMDSNPDCVTFEGWMSTNGGNRVDWVIMKGERYEERNGKYYRFPNHLVPIKKSIATQVKFPPKWVGEDYEWAKTINDLGLIKTSAHIPLRLYHYKFLTHK